MQDGYTLETIDIYGIVDGKEEVIIPNVSSSVLDLVGDKLNGFVGIRTYLDPCDGLEYVAKYAALSATSDATTTRPSVRSRISSPSPSS